MSRAESVSRAPGVIVAAPASGSGKTTVTLGVLRHFKRAGVSVSAFKVGPDYIDPGFLSAACGRETVNLDGWAMRPSTLEALAAEVARDASLVIGEGVMGLFDGASDGSGSTADIAVLTGWPVVLVVDAAAQGQSVAALVRGFATHREDISIAAIVFNRIGSERHASLLREAVAPLAIPLLGCLPRSDGLVLPDRHLGLVQASEHGELAAVLDRAADLVAAHLDLAALEAIARPAAFAAPGAGADFPALGQRIAVAADDAFRFAYPHLLAAWRRGGAEIVPFSPLADVPPDGGADAVYLPGGYPELHAGRLAANTRFLDGLAAAAGRGAAIYGECGGYMVLGEGLIDGDGARHRMAGLLPLETSFAARRLHLGYRALILVADGPLGRAGARFRGHEFHYATIVREPPEAPMFTVADAAGADLGHAGIRRGTVAGSFLHLIDRA